MRSMRTIHVGLMGGQNVFDVFTKAQGTGLDGMEYKDGNDEILQTGS